MTTVTNGNCDDSNTGAGVFLNGRKKGRRGSLISKTNGVTISTSITPPPHETGLNKSVTEHLNPKPERSHSQRHRRSSSTSSPASTATTSSSSLDSPSTFSCASPPAPTTLLSVARSLNDQITQFLETPVDDLPRLLVNVQTQTRISLEVIEETLERWKWGEVAISFNGGKDCLVLLILLLAAIGRKFCVDGNDMRKVNLEQPSQPVTIPSIYVSPSHPFPEIDLFVSRCVSSYHLSLTTLPLPMRPAFERYLEMNKAVKAIFVGTRRTDPHGENLTWFNRTDHGWPDFVRVHPVVEWHYQEVWAFLRHHSIPYCPLYDLGYTSLGGTNDTFQNPVLAIGDGKGGKRFRPAYELLDDGQERLGRENSRKR